MEDRNFIHTDAMKFGLILCTYGRSWDVVHNFIDSLMKNTHKQWELIIVDQNESDGLEKNLFDLYQNEIRENKIKYFRVNFKGLSASRNFGLTKLSQDVDIIAFPDDDCEYPEDLLSIVSEKFSIYKDIDIITGISIDKDRGTPSNGKWRNKSGFIDLYNVWMSGISYTIFINAKSVSNFRNGLFDEKLGAGPNQLFGSGEESDLLIRLLRDEKKGYFFSDIKIYHPHKELTDCRRVKLYARGMGAVFRKNFNFNNKYICAFIKLMIFRPIGGVLLNLFRFKYTLSKIYLISLINRWIGFFKW